MTTNTLEYDCTDSQSCDDPMFMKSFHTDFVDCKNSKSKGFTCYICNYIASSSQRLDEHLSRHTGIKNLECEVCGKKFSWRYSFRNHMAIHREDNPFKCSMCGKVYCNRSSMKNHILRIHGNPRKNFKCASCNKVFVTKSELNRHSYSHSKENPYICEFCGKTYKFKAALLVHNKIHSGDNHYKCEYCEKEFIHLSSIIGHRRRHTGEMPYQCNECGKFFRLKRALAAHMPVHTKVKPFNCNKCEKSFKSRSAFRVHLDFHLNVKRYKCKFCDKPFRAWCNMQKHVKRHLLIKPQKCESCDKSYFDQQELNIHTKVHFQEKKYIKTNRCNVEMSSSCNDVILPDNLTCNSTDIIQTDSYNNPGPSELIPTHLDLSENQAAMFECSLQNGLEKCQAEKCTLLQDNYVSQFLYPSQTPQYPIQNTPVLSMYNVNDTNTIPTSSRPSCASGMNSANYSCMVLNNQGYGEYSFNMPNSEIILSKCKLCRSFFNSASVLRNHLLDYHRIEEESIEDLLN